MKLKIKVCGLRDQTNYREVERLAPDYVGFIFHEASPRFCPYPPTGSDGTSRVGVFVNETLETIVAKAAECSLDAIQLHGDETPELCLALKRRNLPVIKAFRVSETFDLSRIGSFEFCDYFLFDAYGDSYGGSGNQFDWQILAEYRGDVPFFLSGGIGPADVETIRKLDHPRFFGVDINSRFEIAPGFKNVAAVNEFISALR